MKFSLPFFKPAPPSLVENLNVEAVYALYKDQPDDLVLLDVRQPDEWREGVIPGSVKISLGALNSHLQTLEKDKYYILVCRSGNRSGTAAQMMESAGFKRLANFQGGMLAWNSHRYPIER
ncbi:MAG: rhodanese-like domain-containing protein [Candidatus Sericytochromatia bacterium]|nr:rhodanese-like domain-containing protein [Candidatus Sericytochromatia bacterium]